MPDSRSARAFLERLGIIPTFRNYGSSVNPGQLLIHSDPLDRPFPEPVVQTYLNGSPQPDRGTTQVWPWPGEDPV